MDSDKIEIQQDSEFITNLITAKPVAAADHFVSVLDANNNPAVFSISTDSKLLLILQAESDDQGGYITIDFGLLCGVTSKVTAFAVRQAADKKIFVAIAADNGTSSTISLLPQLDPGRLLSPPTESILGNNSTFPQTKLLFLSDYDDVQYKGIWYPKIILSYKAIDRIANQEDLGVVQIDTTSGNLSLDKTFYIPANPTRILDVGLCKSKIGRGAVFLYEAQGQRFLMYVTYDGTKFSVKPKCPPGANCLETFVDPATKLSSLVIGANGFVLFEPKQYTDSSSSGTSISSDPNVLSGVQDLEIIQHGTALSFWFTNKDNAAGYYTTTTTAVAAGSLTMLLSKGSANQLSGLICFEKQGDGERKPVNCLVTVGDEKNMTLLRQSATAGTWQTYPMTITTPANNFEVPSFTTRISLKPDRFRSAAFALVHLISSGNVDAFVNGKALKLTPEGEWYPTDASGELVLIVATADLSTVTLSIDKVEDSAGKSFTLDAPVPVTPASKVFAKLDELSTVEQLKNAKTRDGAYLVDQNVVSEDDIKEAAKTMKAFKDQAEKLDALNLSRPTNGVNGAKQDCTPRFIAGTMSLSRRKELLQDVGGIVSPSEAWHWLVQKAHDAVTWGLHQLGDVLHFTIELAGEVWDFIVDRFPALGNALTWVFSKLRVVWGKIRDFFEFFFNWQDILQTKQVIYSFFDSSLKFYAEQTSGLAEKVHANLEKIRENIRDESVEPDVPVATEEPGDPKAKEAQKGVGYNWGTYQLMHAGGIQGLSFKDPAGSEEPWDAGFEVLANTFKRTEDLVDTVGIDLLNLFMSSNATMTNKALEKLTVDVQDKALGVVDSIATGILNLIAKIIAWIDSQATHYLDIPIFTRLYAKITGGSKLSVLDLLALLLAIPVTLLCKAVTGKKPPMLNGGTVTVDYIRSVFTENISDEAYSELNTVSNLACIAATGLGVYLANISFVLGALEPMSLQKTKVGGFPMPLITHVDKISLFIGVVGTVFSAPLWNKHSKVTPWIAYSIWSATILRQTIAAIKILYELKKPVSDKANKIIAGINLGVQIPVMILQCIAAKEVESHDEGLDIMNAVLTLLATAAKSVARFVGEDNPEVSGFAQGTFIFLTYYALLPVQAKSLYIHIDKDLFVQPTSTA